jgi:hypothetical protein
VDTELQVCATGLVEFLEVIFVLGDCHRQRSIASEVVNGFVDFGHAGGVVETRTLRRYGCQHTVGACERK